MVRYNEPYCRLVYEFREEYRRHSIEIHANCPGEDEKIQQRQHESTWITHRSQCLI